MGFKKISAAGFLFLLLFSGAVFGRDRDVALYRDRGAWNAEVTRALPAVLEWAGLSWRWVDASFIEGGGLRDSSGKPRFRLLVVPGGWAVDYKRSLGGMRGAGKGDDLLREYVAAGGGYLGFCAGAFAACDKVKWVGRIWEYYWDLFPGVGEGPLPWNPLKSGKLTAVHGKCVLDLTRAAFQGQGLPSTVRPLLFGGPRFTLHNPGSPPAGWAVLARHGEDGSPAIVSFLYPDAKGGRVVLCSFHPAFLTGDKGLYDREEEDLSAAGAGKDPDGCLPDWRLARALLFFAAGLKPGPKADLPANRGFLQVPSTTRLGTVQTLGLSEPGSPGATFLVLAALSRAPGVPIRPGLVLPLAFDPLLYLCAVNPGAFRPNFSNLDGSGKAVVRLAVPSQAELSGLSLSFAFLLLKTTPSPAILSVSAPAGTTLY